MYITVSQFANAINNLERIDIDNVYATYEINFINNYGHIVYSEYKKNCTKEQATKAAKKKKDLYPECYIELINLDMRKRYYIE